MMKSILRIVLASLALFPVAAGAATLGSLTIDDTAFVDDISVVSGSLKTYDSTLGALAGIDVRTPDEAATGGDVNSGVWCTASCSFDIFFLDNHIVNGAGDDLVIFEGGANENLSVTGNGITLILDTLFDTEEAGFVDAEGFQIGYWLIDVSEFGLGTGDTLSTLRIDLLFDEAGGGDFASADFVAAGGLNSVVVPLPASLPILLLGLATLGILTKRQRRTLLSIDTPTA
ncbi:MAG: hypothetical protein KJN60_00585 [Boseongicola sp.]|nr:hypothetical protein [Boseongicola sp.]